MRRKSPLKKRLALASSLLWIFCRSAQPRILSQTNDEGSALQTISLREAIARADQYGLQMQAADIIKRLAREDTKQARAGTLPTLSALNQFIYTQGNGTPSGVFVANDGVHIYNEQAVVHEELLSLIRRGEVHLAAAAQIVAQARADVAARGLRATVVQNYFAVAAAERRLKNAQVSLAEAQQFQDITQKQERGGEAAHSDVIKAQLSVLQRQRDMQDGQLAIQKAKIGLAVLIFRDLQVNYEIVDDVSQIGALPPFEEANVQANASSPELKFAQSSLKQARLSVSVARYAYLPSLGLDFWYGIDANQFAARTYHPAPESGQDTLPNYLVPYRQNLGYAAAATLTVPIWNWGAIRSKVTQADLKRRQAELDLTGTRRQVQADILNAYREAQTALSQVDFLRSSSDLSGESLRLTLLRYKAGEATALEVVDAQTTANLARGAYNDGLVRYRIALLTLQILTGSFQP
jgi:outer membrane protein TolC